VISLDLKDSVLNGTASSTHPLEVLEDGLKLYLIQG
jgi:hypothetical protein